MNDSNFTIKGLKTWETHDGGGYQFNLYLDGKKFAWVHDDGHGGATDVSYYAEGNHKLLQDYIDTMPQYDYCGLTMTPSIDTWLGDLLDKYERNKKLAKLRKNAILFRLTTDDEKEFRSLSTLDMNKAKAWLDKNHPDQYILI